MASVAKLPNVPRSEHAPKLLRFPPDLAEAIEAIAQAEDRTFQAQVFRMLRAQLALGRKAKK